MKFYKIYNTLYVVINKNNLKQFFKTEDNYQHAMDRIYNEAIKRNCERVKILNIGENNL